MSARHCIERIKFDKSMPLCLHCAICISFACNAEQMYLSMMQTLITGSALTEHMEEFYLDTLRALATAESVHQRHSKRARRKEGWRVLKASSVHMHVPFLMSVADPKKFPEEDRV